MKKRSLGKMFLLEIVTLGIYRLVFFIKTRREIMARDPSIKIKSPVLLFIPFAIIVLAVTFFVVSIIGTVNGAPQTCTTTTSSLGTSGTLTTISNGQKVTRQTCTSKTDVASLLATLGLYGAFFVSFIFFVIWEWSYAHAVDKITGAKLSFAMTLIVLLLVPDGIDILIVQDYFNKLDDHLPVGAQPPVAPATPIAPAA